MVSQDTRKELEESLGRVPSFVEALAPAAADHSWGIMRDLELGETELSHREKALVAIGAASAMQCQYCIHFHREEARLHGVSDDEVGEAANVAATVRYFSSVLHGAEMDLDEFEAETAAIMDHVRTHQQPADD
ncbi:carboxymuconolactone decarboxylase family protein [Haloglomus litoreum]|uniref:carboxymuconolactone decarboxylase family protein n=1 Tax=Haloglomus litoreum TaxID=3034026 RepID=UPI0023E827C3|nr:carboxymuconolactone decarboxylase family protein [Haloglomus sp. DT116]